MDKTVVIVEDSTDIGELLAYALTFEGYASVIFKNAEDVLEALPLLLTSSHIVAFLVDFLLPDGGMNGIAFVRELEKRGQRLAPVLVISGQWECQREAKDIGAEGFLLKPFNVVDMTRQLDGIVETFRERQKMLRMLL